MRFARVALAFLCLGSWNLAFAQKPEIQKGGLNFYPLQKGNQWHYQVSANGGKGELTFQIADIDTIKGKKASRLETLSNKVATANEHLILEKNGLFRHKYNGLALDPPVCVLKLPFKEGETWKNQIKVPGAEVEMNCKATEKKIEVPAGKFKTIHVQIDFQVNGAPCKTGYWFADGVGMVKQTLDFGQGEITLEMKEFIPAKP